MVNVDFANVKAVMSHAGSALMAIGHAAGENRAVEAAQAAISSPLLDVSITGAKGVLLNIAGADFTLHEVGEAARIVQEAADPDANIIFGAVVDSSLKDEIQVTVIATGFDQRPHEQAARSGSRYSSAFDRRQQAAAREPGSGQRPSGEQSSPAAKTRPAYQPPSSDDDDLDIPAFIRRR